MKSASKSLQQIRVKNNKQANHEVVSSKLL